LVLLLDQFSRHVYRDSVDRDQKVKHNDLLALDITNRCIQKDVLERLEIPQRIFLLMPFRHTPTMDRMNLILSYIENMGKVQEQQKQLLTRFRRNTIRRIQNAISTNLCPTDILDHHEFKADFSKLEKHRVVKCIRGFMADYKDNQNMIVSLSGGVDSMVITRILAALRSSLNITVVAVHIDYGNRDESKYECDFVQDFCRRHSVVFRKRTITSVKRGITARDEYEKITRKIRFDTYTEVLKDFPSPGIIFGHHQGDVQENVLSNVMKRSSCLGLSGMTRTSIVNGVQILRPMLPLLKSEIYDFAHSFGVPYFKDSTPKWSNRGRLRNELIPLLKDIYGDGFLNNLSILAAESDELGSLMKAKVFAPFMESIIKTPVAVYFDAERVKNESEYFWRRGVRLLTENIMGVGRPCDNAIPAFLRDLQSGSYQESRWVPMKRDYKVLMHGGNMMFFYPEFFPFKEPGARNWLCRDYFPKDCVFEVDGQQVQYGPWTVSLTSASFNLMWESRHTRLSIYDIISGDFSYYIPFKRCAHYEINRKVKTKPGAFRGLGQLHIKQVLPVVLPRQDDTCADSGVTVTEPEFCVKVDINFSRSRTTP